MSRQIKKLKLKMVKIECAHFQMRVWSNICVALSRTYYFCLRNKMHKTGFVVHRLYNKAFAMHDICYRKTKHMLEAVEKECDELEE